MKLKFFDKLNDDSHEFLKKHQLILLVARLFG